MVWLWLETLLWVFRQAIENETKGPFSVPEERSDEVAIFVPIAVDDVQTVVELN